MNIDDYKDRVIGHFRSGAASDECWSELADVVLFSSERPDYETRAIDRAIMSEDEFDEYYGDEKSERLGT